MIRRFSITHRQPTAEGPTDSPQTDYSNPHSSFLLPEAFFPPSDKTEPPAPSPVHGSAVNSINNQVISDGTKTVFFILPPKNGKGKSKEAGREK